MHDVVPLPRPPTADLVRRAAQGDESAFCALIRAHEPTLYRAAWAILSDSSDACDAVQEAIFRAWRALPSLHDPAFFKTWFTRIAINECKMLLRHRKRVAPMPDTDLPAPLHPIDESLDVRRALQSLPDKYRAPVVLYYYEDFSVDQIAHALALPQGTVKSRLYLARQQLKTLLEVDEP